VNDAPNIVSILLFIDTFTIGLLGFFVKSKFQELDRVSNLLNTTREESARDHVTRDEVRLAIDRLGDRVEGRLDKLSDKIDALHRHSDG
jgi:hypothetical protein